MIRTKFFNYCLKRPIRFANPLSAARLIMLKALKENGIYTAVEFTLVENGRQGAHGYSKITGLRRQFRLHLPTKRANGSTGRAPRPIILF
jgi:hypothetical protein